MAWDVTTGCGCWTRQRKSGCCAMCGERLRHMSKSRCRGSSMASYAKCSPTTSDALERTFSVVYGVVGEQLYQMFQTNAQLP